MQLLILLLLLANSDHSPSHVERKTSQPALFLKILTTQTEDSQIYVEARVKINDLSAHRKVLFRKIVEF